MTRLKRNAIALAVGIILGGVATYSHAGGEQRPKHMSQGFKLPSSSTSFSTSGAISSAAAAALVNSNPAAAASLTGGNLTTGDTSYNSTSKAYALGMASLTTSQGDCPLLGSASIAVVAFTYEIELCKLRQELALMGAANFSPNSILNRLCQYKGIAEVSSECTNRTISRPE